MTTKINNTMELNLNELEIVTGGTVGELEDLVHAFVCTGSDYGVLFAAHCPGANYGTAKIVEELLNSALGISADIDLGFCGTGINSKPNKYIDKATGKTLTHEEVIARIYG
ncbi:MAG: hypothetical protein K6E72_09515 [Saccharofermentans sp.]|jgi:hypothetical protein|nr:hypothetical protein [Saccharofermentans sp.]